MPIDYQKHHKIDKIRGLPQQKKERRAHNVKTQSTYLVELAQKVYENT